MLAWRLLLATGEARFADLIERTLYNIVATSPAPDGRRFFYANPLHQRVPGTVPATTWRAGGRRRACASRGSSWPAARPTWPARSPAWPPTSPRPTPTGCRSTSTSTAASPPRSRTAVGWRSRWRPITPPTVGAGAGHRCRGGPWSLTLRVPSWADGARAHRSERDTPHRRVRHGGRGMSVRARRRGDPRVCRSIRAGRCPDPRIDAVRGCVAVERGPMVMCVESVDLPGRSARRRHRGRSLDAPREVDGDVFVSSWIVDRDDPSWPYGGVGIEQAVSAPAVDVGLRPYHDWATRGAVDDARLDAGSSSAVSDVVTMSAHERYVIGVDFGTLSGRALVVRVDDGEELAHGGARVHARRAGRSTRRRTGACAPTRLGAAGTERLPRRAADTPCPEAIGEAASIPPT